jgi:hypothetical protein
VLLCCVLLMHFGMEENSRNKSSMVANPQKDIETGAEMHFQTG